MKVKALEFYKNGFMREVFAFGGSMDKELIDMNKTYPASLQNYLIDTGKEIILVDTGLPKEMKDPERKPDEMLYTGEKIADFETALLNLGYKVEDIDKVLVTHKHPDHTGELRLFKNAKIYISKIEADSMGLKGDNIQRVKFESGKYENFDKSEEIVENIYMVPAPGHTKGNSIILVKDEKLHYMIHGDVTYTDKALIDNHLSIVMEDKDAAEETLNKVREFVEQNDTVYLSTHSQESIDSLKDKKIIKL